MNKSEAEEYTQGLEQSLAGGYRLYAWAQRNGIPNALGVSTEEWIRRVGGYVKMPLADRREAINELKEDGHSNREIGKLLGVAEGTVRNDLSAQNCADDEENENFPNGHNKQTAQNCADDEEGNHVRGTFGTGENEWYTPAEHLDLARRVLGKIDLDPASNEQAQKTVRATSFYTKDDDGLTKDWHGSIWLNPPYAQPHIANFAEKMVTEWDANRVTSAIVLTHNYTDTAWFQKLAAKADAICFTRGRVRFISPSGELAAPTQGQAFFYFGKRAEVFAEVFKSIGFVANDIL